MHRCSMSYAFDESWTRRAQGDMKICLVSQEYPPETGGGGIGTQTYLKAQGLSARGHEVHVLSASSDTQARSYLDGRANVHRIPYPQSHVFGYEESTRWLLYSAKVAEKLTELNEAHSFDIFQFPEYGAEGFLYQTDTFQHRSAKYVVQMHGPLTMFVEHMGWPDRGSTFHQVGAFMERAVLQHADKLLASSRNTASFCESSYGIIGSEVEVIHSALDVARFYPVSKPRSSSVRLLFVGNMVDNKGASLLVRSLVQLKRRLPQLELRMIGKGDRTYIEGLRHSARKAGTDGNLDIIGYVRYCDLPAHYAWADIFVGPSAFEPGPGNIYLEAMASGRPVIACNSGGTPEVVLDGETGILVPPDDVEALVAAIEKLAIDVALRERLSRQARAWIESRFTLKKYIDRVESIYQQLLQPAGMQFG
jgi:glycosyltransferase involved in cell wall biosynthesis